MTARRNRTGVVLILFVIFAVAPFAYAATRPEFWQHKHSLAPFVTALYLAVVASLVVGRRRWAWALLALFYAGGDAGWLFDSHTDSSPERCSSRQWASRPWRSSCRPRCG